MHLKRWLYGLPLMSGYRGLRTRALAGNHRDHPLGFKFAGHEQYFSNFEARETKIMLDALQGVDVMIDIGANLGFYTCLAASRGKTVACVEPEPGNLNYLLSNVEKNSFNAEVFPLAMAETAGVLTLYGDAETASVVPDWFGNRRSFAQKVASNSLDNLFKTRWPGQKIFIKIDVEGYEEFVIAGAHGLIAREPRPIWLIECMAYQLTGNRPRNPFFVTMFEIMFAAGYEAFSIDEGRTIEIDEIKRLAFAPVRPPHDALFNFLFREAQ
jgi:FkbM family methyltransferase